MLLHAFCFQEVWLSLVCPVHSLCRVNHLKTQSRQTLFFVNANFVEVWYESPHSQDTLKRRIHFPFDLERYFLLMLRFRSDLTCANTVSVFPFFKSSVFSRIGLLLINLSVSLSNLFCQAYFFFWPLSEWGVVSKFSLVPWIPETPPSPVISLSLSRDFPLPCLSPFMQFLPVAMTKIREIHLCIRNVFNEQLS